MNGRNVIDLSIVVLCYRSEETIIPFVSDLKEELSSITNSWELVLVGNYLPGANDRTGEIVQSLALDDDRVIALVEPKQGMMGWDMRKGLQAANGGLICVIDGDGQFPVNAISKCYDTIVDCNLDMMKTFRINRRDGIYRYLISATYNLLFSLLFPGLGSSDINSKPKIMTRAAYQKMNLSSDDWFIDAEIMINVRRHKMSFKEIPIQFNELVARRSFINYRAILEFIRNLIVYRFHEFIRSK